MCGWVFVGGKNLRRIAVRDLQARIQKEWLEGPVVYKNIMSLDPGGGGEAEVAKTTVICCHTCLKRPGNHTAMMPMDHYLLYLIAPTTLPDQRRHKRMRATLLRVCKGGEVNPYASPRWVLRIAEHRQPIQAWWERNLQTQFFQHKHTARVVRLQIRKGAKRVMMVDIGAAVTTKDDGGDE
jgi:hypothetical protein